MVAVIRTSGQRVDLVAVTTSNSYSATVSHMASQVKDPRPSQGDGRSTRWSEHREARRTELVAAAVSAIDEHGPAASIAEMAASAGVSKPVLYRYFADKDDLYRAVGQWGAEQVMAVLVPTLLADAPMRDKVYRA